MNILLINGAQVFAHSHGALNASMQEIAKNKLIELGHNTQETHIDRDGYNEENEIKKILWSDVIIYQMPGWWMMMPWKMKKYMDDVYTAGYQSLYENDGRTRSEPNKQYGTGGLLHGKKYMISVTWNAPIEAFNESNNFFEAKEIDGVYFAFHKSQQFLGLEKLPSFMVNDVIKNPQFELYKKSYESHLAQIFKKS